MSKFDYQSDWHCAKTCDRLVLRVGRLITSQIDTTPKQSILFVNRKLVWLPVRLTLRQNYQQWPPKVSDVWLPVRLTLRQNYMSADMVCAKVWLPVRLTLRQNRLGGLKAWKTVWLPVRLTLRQNAIVDRLPPLGFDYQSDWHCAKTSNARCN